MHHPPTEQEQAHIAVRRALLSGRLRREPCVVCWATPTSAHHPRGYDAEHRLDVVWLCNRCHERIHGRAISPSVETEWRRMRETAGLSLSKVAAAAGINKGRLSIIERGVPPTTEEASRILAALQVEVLPREVAG